VVAAGRKTIARGRELAAEALETARATSEYRDGAFRIAGTDRAIGLAEPRHAAGEGVPRIGYRAPSTPSWPNGAQVCEVEIDPRPARSAREHRQLRRHRPGSSYT